MANRKLKMLLNVGMDDQKKYGIPDGEAGGPPRENEVVSVDDKIAKIMVNVLQCAVDYDAGEEAEHQARVRASDEERLSTAVAAGMITPEQAQARLANQPVSVAAPVDSADSPVKDASDADAIQKIAGMRSHDKLQQIADRDSRLAVADAAKKRLTELGPAT